MSCSETVTTLITCHATAAQESSLPPGGSATDVPCAQRVDSEGRHALSLSALGIASGSSLNDLIGQRISIFGNRGLSGLITDVQLRKNGCVDITLDLSLDGEGVTISVNPEHRFEIKKGEEVICTISANELRHFVHVLPDSREEASSEITKATVNNWVKQIVKEMRINQELFLGIISELATYRKMVLESRLIELCHSGMEDRITVLDSMRRDIDEFSQKKFEGYENLLSNL